MREELKLSKNAKTFGTVHTRSIKREKTNAIFAFINNIKIKKAVCKKCRLSFCGCF